MKYLSIDGDVLANKTIPSASKIIISYMLNLEKGGKAFYGTHAYLSDTLGIRYEYLEKCMASLIKQGILHITDEGIKPNKSVIAIAKESHSGLC